MLRGGGVRGAMDARGETREGRGQKGIGKEEREPGAPAAVPRQISATIVGARQRCRVQRAIARRRPPPQFQTAIGGRSQATAHVEAALLSGGWMGMGRAARRDVGTDAVPRCARVKRDLVAACG